MPGDRGGSVSAFGGFPRETFGCLEGIAEHNDKEWLAANRALNEAAYMPPARLPLPAPDFIVRKTIIEEAGRHEMKGFAGFPRQTADFLVGISDHNEKSWFEANRPLYEAGYVEAGRAFVEAIGPALRQISPGVGFEPKIGRSLMRINRDIRFSRDKRPYKDHLDLWFWHGEGRGWTAPGFFLRLTPSMLWLGTGMHALEGEMLTRFRDAVIDDASGAELVRAVETVRAAGPYVVGGKTRRQVPRGYDKAHPRAEYLLHEALYAHYEAPAEVAYDPAFGAHAVEHFRNTRPIAQWLLDRVVR